MASAPSVPTGLSVSASTTTTVDIAWPRSTNTSGSWKTLSWTGCVYGFYSPGGAWGGTGDTVLAHEALINRQSAIAKRYYDFHAVPWLTAGDDLLKMCNGGQLSTGETVTGGRTPYLAIETVLNAPAKGVFPGMPTPAGSTSDFGGDASNDVYTYLQIGQVDVGGTVTRAGVCDAILTTMAARIKAFGKPVFWTLDHEFDNAVTGGQGTNLKRAAALRETPVRTVRSDGSVDYKESTNPHWSEYAAALRYVVKFFNDHGATNHVHGWVTSGFRGTAPGSAGQTLYQAAFPGTAWVDAVGWEPYDHNSTSANRMGSFLLNHSSWYTNLDANFLGAGTSTIPRFLGELGVSYRANNTRATVAFANWVPDFQAYPKVKMVCWFESGTWGNLHAGGTTGTWDNAAIAQMKTALATTYMNPNTSASGSGVGGYKVYEGTTLLATVTGDVASPSVHLTGLTAGSAHNFTVSAFDTSGTPLESAKSAPLAVTLPTATVPPLPAPAPFTTTPAPNPPQAQFTWAAVPGATGYHLQRATDAGPYAQIAAFPAGQTSSVTTGLTLGHVYTFRISTLNSAGVEGPWSVELTVDTTGTVAPISPPAGLSSSVSTAAGSVSSQVTLMWQAAPDSRVIEYWIYRDNDPGADSTTGPTARVAAGTLTWTDPVLQRPGETHTYFLLAADASSPAVLSPAVSLVVTANVAPNSSPLASLTLSSPALTLPADGSGVVFLMDASGSTDPNGDPLTFTFTVDDGQGQIGPQTAPTAARRIYSPGIYTVTVQVADPTDGVDRVSQTLTVSPPAGLVTPNLHLVLPLNNQAYGPAGNAPAKSYWQQETQNLQLLDAAGIGTALPASAQPAVGEYLAPYTSSVTTTTLAAGDSGKMWLVPVDVRTTGMVFDSVAVGYNTAFTGGTHILEFGVYPDDGSLAAPSLPDLLFDWGSLTLASAGLVGVTLPATWTPSPGRYWLAVSYNTSGSVTTYPTFTVTNNAYLASSDLRSTTQSGRCYYVTGVAGALPTSGTLTKSTVTLNVGVHRSA